MSLNFPHTFFISAVLRSGMGTVSNTKRRAATHPSSPKGVERDRARMSELVAFTAGSLRTPRPRPFGASIFHTESGKMLLRALNAVLQEWDPSSHAEVRAIRKATKRLKLLSLAGYTLYTTCEPCPMCMSAALWAGLDRVVYGATIEDANRHCNQIQIPATEVAARSDMTCSVDGPLLRDECYALFTHPEMLKAFRLWSTRKRR
jgi:tRNA(Arg) A34 adenosine deaminase TadA